MARKIRILLSAYNGAVWLPALLDSLAAQTHGNWSLLWRDDGSTDGTVALLTAAGFPKSQAAGRLGVLDSFLTLLREAAAELPDRDLVAFCDQDDVWLPEKLARAVAALETVPAGKPALYCARQVLVDDGLRRIALSLPVRAPGFPASLTQNIAAGCTIVMNAAAARLVAGSTPPSGSIHDWWCYLVVSACGGAILADDTPTVLYRQHGGNAVGAPATRLMRGLGAIRRGPAMFMAALRDHVAALRTLDADLSPAARISLSDIETALRGGMRERVRGLTVPGLRRQTALETAVFRAWFLIG